MTLAIGTRIYIRAVPESPEKHESFCWAIIGHVRPVGGGGGGVEGVGRPPRPPTPHI